MTIDKFGRTSESGEQMTNMGGVSHEYLSNNLLIKVSQEIWLNIY